LKKLKQHLDSNKVNEKLQELIAKGIEVPKDTPIFTEDGQILIIIFNEYQFGWTRITHDITNRKIGLFYKIIYNIFLGVNNRFLGLFIKYTK
jgi:hypothetical protein